MSKINAQSNDMGAYLFHQGTNFYSYEYLGCHESFIGGKYEYTFRVWAPNAEKVELVSDFIAWDNGKHLEKITNGIWETTITSDHTLVGKYYKYKITNQTFHE